MATPLRLLYAACLSSTRISAQNFSVTSSNCFDSSDPEEHQRIVTPAEDEPEMREAFGRRMLAAVGDRIGFSVGGPFLRRLRDAAFLDLCRLITLA